jgi:membrane protein DedA with SNARE-associated domain
MISCDEFLTYLGVFGALVVSALGAPIPEEIPIITAGVLVGNQWNNPESWLVWWIMLPVCILGVVTCDTLLYLIGRRWGPRLLVKKWFQKYFISLERQKSFAKNFHNYGILILLTARLLPGVRTPIFFYSGTIMPFRRFLFADALYAIPGVNLLFWLSYWFTDQFIRAFNKVEGNRPIVMAVILAAIAGSYLFSFLKRRVATGDPMDIPIVGKQVAELGHHLHRNPDEPPPGDLGDNEKKQDEQGGPAPEDKVGDPNEIPLDGKLAPEHAHHAHANPEHVEPSAENKVGDEKKEQMSEEAKPAN